MKVAFVQTNQLLRDFFPPYTSLPTCSIRYVMYLKDQSSQLNRKPLLEKQNENLAFVSTVGIFPPCPLFVHSKAEWCM